MSKKQTPDTTTVKKKKKRRRRVSRGGGKKYFTKVHEDAIVQYALSDSREEKTKLYVEIINPALNELVDKTVYTYKFTNLPNIEDLKAECKVWLTTILDKFDPSKGSKAFSYYSVITKNWFIHKVKRTALQNRREVYYDQMPKEMEQEQMSTTNQYFEIRESGEFWNSLWKEIKQWESVATKPNEKKVIDAIKILLSEPDAIEIFNKKAIYFYIREITGLNTKQVVSTLNKLRVRYASFKEKWNEGEI
jgi:DNA-directed RNA polymerase specialized sigma subunit